MQIKDTNLETLQFSQPTRIHIDVADSSVLPLLFVSSLSILSGCCIINIHSCHHQNGKLSCVGQMEYHPHTRIHYPKRLTYLSYDYGIFIYISGMELDKSGYGQFLK
jgi:hypothetical protein